MLLKWKIFLALNFVLSLPALIFLILFIINFSNSFRSSEDYFFGFLFIFGSLMITLNGFLNIYLIQRFFPDKLLPAGVKRLNLLSLVLNIGVAIGLLILGIYAAKLELGHNYRGKDASGKIALAVIFFLWLVQVAVLTMQGQLPGLISRNNRESMRSLIDSIGQ